MNILKKVTLVVGALALSLSVAACGTMGVDLEDPETYYLKEDREKLDDIKFTKVDEDIIQMWNSIVFSEEYEELELLASDLEYLGDSLTENPMLLFDTGWSHDLEDTIDGLHENLKIYKNAKARTNHEDAKRYEEILHGIYDDLSEGLILMNSGINSMNVTDIERGVRLMYDSDDAYYELQKIEDKHNVEEL